jgi:hypothetical protein
MRPTDAAYGLPREYKAYDCLQSSPRFQEAMFEKIWTKIFDFATESAGTSKRVIKPKPIDLAAAA